MPTNPVAPSAVPDFPALSDRTTYNAKAYAWAQHMDTVYPAEMHALATVTHGNAVEAAASAVTASGYVATVEASASAAAASAVSAADVSNAGEWVSGATYAQGNCVWSPTSFLTYRRKSSGAGVTDPASDPTNWQALASSSVAPGYINGFKLANNSTNKIDVTVGYCADSTNAAAISGTAFTKATSGTWAAGSNGNGMGVGLTIANTTWYHVFAIIVSGAFDVYFDTSAAAANKPVGTTAFRRIGSFLTNGSAQIIAFKQYGNHIYWTAAVHDVNTGAPPSSATLTTFSVPTGVSVYPINYLTVTGASGGGSQDVYLYSPLHGQGYQPSARLGIFGVTNSPSIGANPPPIQLTSVNAQLFYLVVGGLATGSIHTLGWIDPSLAANW